MVVPLVVVLLRLLVPVVAAVQVPADVEPVLLVHLLVVCLVVPKPMAVLPCQEDILPVRIP
jgi:hypothetical protein